MKASLSKATPHSIRLRLLATLLSLALPLAAAATDNNAPTNPTPSLSYLQTPKPIGSNASAERDPKRDIKLPDFGRSASVGADERDEYYYSRQVLREFRNSGILIEDPEIDEYLRTLATRLGEASEKPDNDFTYVLLKDEEFNAFAVPGGLIGIHAGLWLQAGTESELAAVLAHENAHVTQKHTIRAMERMKQASLPIMLGTLATAIAASRSSNSGGYSPYDSPNRVDNTVGALVAGQALLAQLQINFTRDNEFEADRIGIQTLKKAGFDVTAMAGMFQRMQTHYRVGSASRPPQYLQTHPISTTRIAEAKTRAEALLDKPVASSSLSFAIMKERVRALRGAGATTVESYYQNSLKTRPDSAPLLYGYAVYKMQQRDFDGAKQLLARMPDLAGIGLAKSLLAADIEFAAKSRQWRGMYTDLLKRFPNHRVISQKYATALLAQGNANDGKKAVTVLRDLTERFDSDPSIYEQLGRGYEVSGDPVRAGEAFANATALRGAFEDALLQLQDIAKRKDLDYYQRARLDAQIAELTPFVLELRARRIDTRQQIQAHQAFR
jgi:beta-barrel assembly-enhancing protease